MRYSIRIGDKAAIVKAAIEGQYRMVMLALMIVEILLLAALVIREFTQ